MNRAERAQLAAEIENRVMRRLAGEAWMPATVIDAPTPSDPQVGVQVDTAEPVTVGADDDLDGETEVEYGQIIGDPPALDERVLVRYRPGGALEVMGTVGGAWRLLGGAVVAGGTADQDETASGAEEALDLLTCEVDVPRPNRWVTVTVGARIGSNAAAGSTSPGVGRIYREDYDAEGNSAGSTFLGLWMTDGVRSFANAGRYYTGSVPDVGPEPGVSRYYATCQVAAGFTAMYDVATDPSVAAFIEVVDRGPIPEDTNLPT